jgi:hypothetical protein
LSTKEENSKRNKYTSEREKKVKNGKGNKEGGNIKAKKAREESVSTYRGRSFFLFGGEEGYSHSYGGKYGSN